MSEDKLRYFYVRDKNNHPITLVGFHTDGEIPTKEDMAKDVPIGAKPDRIAMLLGASHYRRVR